MPHLSEYEVETRFLDRLESLGYTFAPLNNYASWAVADHDQAHDRAYDRAHDCALSGSGPEKGHEKGMKWRKSELWVP